MSPTAAVRIWHNTAAMVRCCLAAFALLPFGVFPASALNFERLPGEDRYYALTFDAHEETRGARELLALLRERGITATVFVTGRFAGTHPELLRAVADDGHEIGNHTFSHPHLTTWAEDRRHRTRPEITREMLQDELSRTAAAIRRAIGREPSPFWRAPYGEHNREIRSWAAELGLVHVDWTRGGNTSLDALDWVSDPRSRLYLDAEGMFRRLLEFEQRSGVSLAGGIVLMHLGSTREDLALLEALPFFLDENDRRGLRPVPVGELFRRSGHRYPGQTGSDPPEPAPH